MAKEKEEMTFEEKIKLLEEIVKELEEDVRKGEMLSNSMRKFPEAFPTLLTSMVESGEASGNLDEMFLRMSTHFEKENKISNCWGCSINSSYDFCNANLCIFI